MHQREWWFRECAAHALAMASGCDHGRCREVLRGDRLYNILSRDERVARYARMLFRATRKAVIGV